MASSILAGSPSGIVYVSSLLYVLGVWYVVLVTMTAAAAPSSVTVTRPSPSTRMSSFHHRPTSISGPLLLLAVVLHLLPLSPLSLSSSSSAASIIWHVDAFSSSSPLQPKAAALPTTTKRILSTTAMVTLAIKSDSSSPLFLHHRTANADGDSDASCISISSRGSSLFMSAGEVALTRMKEEDEDEEMEWVEEEFELLTERDFYNTEWKIGTLMDNKPRDAKSIDTTWVRLVTTDSGENEAIWGDGAKGKWTIDVPSQFFSISKESFGGWLGKKIWAGTIEDFYYLEGTVRGWGPISPASVVGQWQGVRLGVVDGERVTAEERGVAPWFAMGDEEEIDSIDADDGDNVREL